MSDYIFSSTPQEAGVLKQLIGSIYHVDAPIVHEFHGAWGSLAVSVNRYRGFLPYENTLHILVALGGPVLCFRDNNFLTKTDSNQATVAIYQRWLVDKKIKWADDLSGAFTFILVDKLTGVVQLVTDLMSFIPVYKYQNSQQFCLSTHVDVLAKITDHQIDEVSITDFILTGVVTFPYTVYEAIKQLPPSSSNKIDMAGMKSEFYWLPKEENNFKSINDAAKYLRTGIVNYVNHITATMSETAHFLSAGEDSRALLGLMPPHLKKSSYVFLDAMNREGRIARQAAKIYDCEFNIAYRDVGYFLNTLPEAADMVGNGQECLHSHYLGFTQKFKLADYAAVFGGFFSDTLLKGHHVKLQKGYYRLPFMPQIQSNSQNPVGARFKLLGQALQHTDAVKQRQKIQFDWIASLRKNSAAEWFNVYPASMHNDFPNFHSTRRLFSSYEPFMCQQAVKVAAGVPVNWKLNRRLFNRAMRPYLKPSKWLIHADGRLPYFGWWLNMPVQFGVWAYRSMALRLGLIKGYQGPWSDWQALFASEQWRLAVDEYTKNTALTDKLFTQAVKDILLSDRATPVQKLDILQTLYGVKAE